MCRLQSSGNKSSVNERFVMWQMIGANTSAQSRTNVEWLWLNSVPSLSWDVQIHRQYDAYDGADGERRLSLSAWRRDLRQPWRTAVWCRQTLIAERRRVRRIVTVSRVTSTSIPLLETSALALCRTRLVRQPSTFVLSSGPQWCVLVNHR